MALYAFDGTGNEDRPDENKDSNVLFFYQAVSLRQACVTTNGRDS